MNQSVASSALNNTSNALGKESQRVVDVDTNNHSNGGGNTSIEQNQQYEDNSVNDSCVCCICSQGASDEKRILRFLPVTVDDSVAATASTFDKDISLHIFCGKTASILPSVNQPDLEILSKAGLKNKHGIGAEVNAALARTRCAVQSENGSKDKHFYLVREFEANLAAVRNVPIDFHNDFHDPFSSIPELPGEFAASQQILNETHARQDYNNMLQSSVSVPAAAPITVEQKIIPARATSGLMQKAGRNTISDECIPIPSSEAMEDGKMRCECGGTHLPTGSQKGIQSWRNHVMTKRHQKWMEDQGMIGAV